MGNETEKNQQNPGQRQQDNRQQDNPGNFDPNKKTPSQSGEQVYNPQDPSTKKPGQDSGTTDRKDREGSEDVEKRRAS